MGTAGGVEWISLLGCSISPPWFWCPPCEMGMMVQWGEGSQLCGGGLEEGLSFKVLPLMLLAGASVTRTLSHLQSEIPQWPLGPPVWTAHSSCPVFPPSLEF